jgi:rhodanese-related sulfurtransferase
MRANSNQHTRHYRQGQPGHVAPAHAFDQVHARVSAGVRRVRPVAKKVDDMLAEARAKLERLDPPAASAAMAEGAVLVDIRADSQRAADGVVPGAVFIPRNVLEWRCDPQSDFRDERVSDPSRRLVVMCNEGYQSSLAAATLRELGLQAATDLDGGFQAWRAAGLPVEPGASG